MKKQDYIPRNWRIVNPQYRKISDFTIWVIICVILGVALGIWRSYAINPYGGFFRSYIFLNWRTLIVYPLLGGIVGVVLAITLFAISFPLERHRCINLLENCKKRLTENQLTNEILEFCKANKIRAICVENNQIRMYPSCGNGEYCEYGTDVIVVTSLYGIDDKIRTYKKPDHWQWCDTAKCFAVNFEQKGYSPLDELSRLAMTEFLCDKLDDFQITKHRAYIKYTEPVAKTGGDRFTYNVSTGRGYFNTRYSGGEIHEYPIYEDYFLYKSEDYESWNVAQKSNTKPELNKW